jgi:signal transduction histidine kinase
VLTDREVLDSLSAGVLMASSDEVTRHANPAACRMLHVALDACLGQPVTLLLGMTASLADHGLTTPGAECRLELNLPAGPAGATLANVGGRGFVCLFRPTDEGRGADPHLARHERESAMAAIVAAFAHEIRNPLAAINAAAEMLRAEMPPPHGDAHIAIIERQVRRLAALARTPVLLGQPSSTQRVLCTVDQLVADAMAIVSGEAQRCRVVFDIAIEPGLPRVAVGERELVDALVALLENAVHASPAGDPVVVGARAIADGYGPRRRVAIEIVDRGAGMAPSEIALALRAFTTTKAGATGSGLALAHRAILDSGGRLALEAPPGQGLIARVELAAEEPR